MRTFPTPLIFLLAISLGGCAAGQSAPATELRLSVPEEPVLAGKPVAIRASGLAPGERVQLTFERQLPWRPGNWYRSEATFAARADGTVSTSTDAPVTGSYAGIDASGPFHSMRRTDDTVPEGVDEDDVLVSLDRGADGTVEATARFDLRQAPASLVETPLGEDHPGAFLLRTEGDEPLPVIYVLGGSEGGDRSARWMAPQLAARGYAVVGYPYYSPAWPGQEQQVPGLPRAFADIPLDRLVELHRQLQQRGDIDASRVGLFGVSKGAEFALAVAPRLPGVRAVAAIVPSDVIWEGWGAGGDAGTVSSFAWQGSALPFVPYDRIERSFPPTPEDKRVALSVPHAEGRERYADRVDAARIPVEDIDAAVLVVGGGQDRVWPSAPMAANICARRAAAGLDTVCIIDPQAGHGLSGNPYEPSGAAEAAVKRMAWPAMLRLFERQLQN